MDALEAPAAKKRLTAPKLGLEVIYFTWGTVSNTVRYAKVNDKLKDHVVVHFWDQASVAASVMEEFKAPVFTKTDRPVHMYCASNDRTVKTKK